MKKATLNKLLASTLAIALCIPLLLADSMAVNASVSGNTPSTGEDSSDGSVSGNTPSEPTDPSEPSNPSDSSSSSEASGSSEATNTTGFASGAVSLAFRNTVTIGGKNVKSTVGGVFIATAVNGVAVTSPVASVNAAIGLSQADVDAGTNARFYICNSSNKEMKAALQSVAAATGKTVGAYINVDLYTITKKGTVTAIRNTAEPITMTFGLPGRIANAGNGVSVICIDKDGQTVIMEDTDTDPKTLTVNTNVFGVYAIVY